MDNVAESDPTFLLPEGIRYTCRMDGRCCRDSWEIRVEDAAKERIEAVDWRACSRLDDSAPSPFERAGSRGGPLLLRRVGEGCHFLNDQSRCALHAAHGFEIKPHACRRFPFRFIDTPDGVYVGVSFACDSVLLDEGKLVSDQEEDLRRLYAQEPERRSVAQPVRLDLETEITWEQYRVIEESLDGILSNSEHAFAECLVAGHVWISMFGQMMRATRRGDEGAGGMKPEEVFDYYIQRTREDGYARAFQIASKQGANRALKRVVLGTALALRHTIQASTGRLAAAARLTIENVRHWARIGSLRMEPLKQKVPYRDFHPDPGILAGSETQALLRRYYRHALFRKDLVASTDLLWGYCYFVLMYGMMQYYATALAMSNEGDPATALCLVEKYYVLHSGFGHGVLYHPAIADTFQRVFTRPNYAHAIVYG